MKRQTIHPKRLIVGLLCSLAISAQATLVTSHNNYNGGTTIPHFGTGPEFLELFLQGGQTDASTSFSMFLASGQTFGGFAAYDPSARPDQLASGEEAFVSVTGPGSFSYMFSDATPASGSDPWLPWGFTTTQVGLYTFTYGVHGDGTKPAYGLFVPVPEPSTWLSGALVGLALLPSMRAGLARIRSTRG